MEQVERIHVHSRNTSVRKMFSKEEYKKVWNEGKWSEDVVFTSLTSNRTGHLRDRVNLRWLYGTTGRQISEVHHSLCRRDQKARLRTSTVSCPYDIQKLLIYDLINYALDQKSLRVKMVWSSYRERIKVSRFLYPTSTGEDLGKGTEDGGRVRYSLRSD